MPVAINAFASRRRMLRALQIESWEDWNARLEFFLDPKPPDGILGKLKAIPRVTELASVFPKSVRSGACQQVVATGEDVDLRQLPVLTCWPQDGGPFITLPLVITKDSASGKTNVGMYRMQVYDRNTTGMHWQKHKDGAGQARGYEREGRRMEVAVAIGCDPATVFSAIAPLPPESPSSSSPDSFAARRFPSSRRRPSTFSFPPRPRSSSRGTSTRRSAAGRGPSGITPASTRSRTSSRSSTSRL